MPEISYIDLDDLIVCLMDGQTAPITELMNKWGDECPPGDAVSAVAGPFSMGWLAIDLEQNPPRTVH